MVNRISEFIKPDNQGYPGRAGVFEWPGGFGLMLLKRSRPGPGIKWNIFYYDGSQMALQKLLTQISAGLHQERWSNKPTSDKTANAPTSEPGTLIHI